MYGTGTRRYTKHQDVRPDVRGVEPLLGGIRTRTILLFRKGHQLPAHNRVQYSTQRRVKIYPVRVSVGIDASVPCWLCDTYHKAKYPA